MLLSDKVTVKWNAKTKKYFENKGYIYTRMHDNLLINTEDLMPESRTIIAYSCDGCGVINNVSYRNYLKSDHDLCLSCSQSRVANRTPFNDIKELFEECGYKLLSLQEEYSNNKSLLRYECPKHGEFITTYNRFKNGNRCPICANEKHSQENRGINNCRYNNKLTDRQRIVTRSIDGYKGWRDSVYKRDSYTCQCCGNSNVKLNAHHVYNYGDYPKLRTEVSNGITLCEETCHYAFHKIYGKSNNTKDQLDEFIKMNKCYHVSNKTA